MTAIHFCQLCQRTLHGNNALAQHNRGRSHLEKEEAVRRYQGKTLQAHSITTTTQPIDPRVWSTFTSLHTVQQRREENGEDGGSVPEPHIVVSDNEMEEEVQEVETPQAKRQRTERQSSTPSRVEMIQLTDGKFAGKVSLSEILQGGNIDLDDNKRTPYISATSKVMLDQVIAAGQRSKNEWWKVIGSIRSKLPKEKADSVMLVYRNLRDRLRKRTALKRKATDAQRWAEENKTIHDIQTKIEAFISQHCENSATEPYGRIWCQKMKEMAAEQRQLNFAQHEVIRPSAQEARELVRSAANDGEALAYVAMVDVLLMMSTSGETENAREQQTMESDNIRGEVQQLKVMHREVLTTLSHITKELGQLRREVNKADGGEDFRHGTRPFTRPRQRQVVSEGGYDRKSRREQGRFRREVVRGRNSTSFSTTLPQSNFRKGRRVSWASEESLSLGQDQYKTRKSRRASKGPSGRRRYRENSRMDPRRDRH